MAANNAPHARLKPRPTRASQAVMRWARLASTGGAVYAAAPAS